MRRVLLLLVGIAVASVTLRAQTTLPSFEVASVKNRRRRFLRRHLQGQRRSQPNIPPGEFDPRDADSVRLPRHRRGSHGRSRVGPEGSVRSPRESARRRVVRGDAADGGGAAGRALQTGPSPRAATDARSATGDGEGRRACRPEAGKVRKPECTASGGGACPNSFTLHVDGAMSANRVRRRVGVGCYGRARRGPHPAGRVVELQRVLLRPERPLQARDADQENLLPFAGAVEGGTRAAPPGVERAFRGARHRFGAAADAGLTDPRRWRAPTYEMAPVKAKRKATKRR